MSIFLKHFYLEEMIKKEKMTVGAKYSCVWVLTPIFGGMSFFSFFSFTERVDSSVILLLKPKLILSSEQNVRKAQQTPSIW